MRRISDTAYKWIICADGLLIHLCNCGLIVTAFSIFLPLLRESVGLTNTQVSFMVTLRSLAALLGTMAAGKYYKKMTLRGGVILASLCIPLVMFLFSVAGSVWGCYLAIVIGGFSYGAGSIIPVSILMHNWFGKESATPISIGACGSSFATIFAPPIITFLTEHFGLQNAFRSVGLFTLVCAVITILILREKPSLRYSDEKERTSKSAEGNQVPDENSKASGSERRYKLLVGREWFILLFVCFLLGAAGTVSTSNMSIHLVTQGYTAAQAAQAISFFGVSLLAGKLIFGFTSDRFGTYIANYVFLGLMALSCLLFVFADGVSVFNLLFPSVLFGLGNCTGAVGPSCWTGDFSAEKEYSERLRRNQTAFSIGALLLTPFPGMIADATGSYSPAFALCAGMGILVLIVIQMLYGKHRKRLYKI